MYVILVVMYDADKPMLVGLILLISVLVGLLSMGILGGSVLPYDPSGQYLKILEVDGTRIKVNVADTKEERINGLSGVDALPRNEGLLFVFDEPGKYPIWMRGMEFSLDIYWLDGQGKIVDAWKNADPSSYPQIYEPVSDAYYILEVNSGFSEVYNIEIGDWVTGL
ncbi:hypothetical protein COB52_00950 [Candidatus Kaiserbacteria bacterium]|nr:MAG: hypothetical protein COB52_00950 [Candidatus Kaiserbacteria bacterium]